MMTWSVGDLEKFSPNKLNGDLEIKKHVPGWMDGWMGGGGWVDGWMDVKSLLKECIQQSKTENLKLQKDRKIERSHCLLPLL